MSSRSGSVVRRCMMARASVASYAAGSRNLQTRSTDSPPFSNTSMAMEMAAAPAAASQSPSNEMPWGAIPTAATSKGASADTQKRMLMLPGGIHGMPRRASHMSPMRGEGGGCVPGHQSVYSATSSSCEFRRMLRYAWTSSWSGPGASRRLGSTMTPTMTPGHGEAFVGRSHRWLGALGSRTQACGMFWNAPSGDGAPPWGEARRPRIFV